MEAEAAPSLAKLWEVVHELVKERAHPTANHRRLIRLPEVLRNVGVSRSEWYRLISLGRAPPAIPLGEKSRAWVESEVQAWVAERIAARDGAAV